MVVFTLRLIPDRRAAALVEFAIVLPLLVALLVGVLGYGQYFLLAHSVQQVANDAARATVAGLNTDERAALARTSVSDDIAALGEFNASRVRTVVTENGSAIAVDIRLDARGLGPFRTTFVPLPDPTIDRRAVVRRGGLS